MWHLRLRPFALVCLDITAGEIGAAEAAGADSRVVEWARLYVADQSPHP